MSFFLFSDEHFMNEALKLAQKASQEGEVPIGAVVVLDNKIIGKGYNLTEKLHDVTAHAEIQAITAASTFLGAKYLDQCTLYVTLEPCVMCAGALGWSQIGRVFYGASDSKRGFSVLAPLAFHPKTEVINGMLSTECGQLVSDFFKMKRA